MEGKFGKDIRGVIFSGGHVEEFGPIIDSDIREVKEETVFMIEAPFPCEV